MTAHTRTDEAGASWVRAAWVATVGIVLAAVAVAAIIPRLPEVSRYWWLATVVLLLVLAVLVSTVVHMLRLVSADALADNRAIVRNPHTDRVACDIGVEPVVPEPLEGHISARPNHDNHATASAWDPAHREAVHWLLVALATHTPLILALLALAAVSALHDLVSNYVPDTLYRECLLRALGAVGIGLVVRRIAPDAIDWLSVVVTSYFRPKQEWHSGDSGTQGGVLQ